jgi:hypothetical protein
MKEDYDWTNKRLVHIWLLPCGWDSSSFNYQLKDEDGELIQFFSLRALKEDRCTATSSYLRHTALKASGLSF